MSAAFHWDGIAALIEQLQRLPVELVADASEIVHRAADDTRTEASAAYPSPRAGDRDAYSLKNGMKIQTNTDNRFGTSARVVHTAWYADIYENGSASARKTKQGWDRGVMPAGHVLIPIAIRRRAAMYDELAALVERNDGVTVTGGSGVGL